MRILHVTDSYLPTIGGMERAVAGLAQYRAREGHQVAVLTGTHPEAPESETTADGVHVFRYAMATQRLPGALVDPRRPFHATLPDPLFVKAAHRVVQQQQPDIIHVHGWSRYSVLPVARHLNIPVIATAHDLGHVCAVKHGTFPDGTVCSGPSLKKCVQHATSQYGAKGAAIAAGMRISARTQRDIPFTALSRSVATFGVNSPYSPRDITVIPSFIPDEAFQLDHLTRPDWLPNGDYLLFVGALTPHKGVDILLQAYQSLRRNANLDMPLVLIGTPQPDTPNLVHPGVQVHTSIPHQEVMASWKFATIGAAPSVLPEGFGQIVVEAMAAGTPIIGTNHGGMTDIITDHVDGLLIEPNSAPALANAIKWLVQHPAERERLTHAAQNRARDFSVSVVAPQLMALYEQIIATPNT